MERQAELRLPTVAVPVRLAMIGHEAAPAELFVFDQTRSGRSQLLDAVAAMLDEDASFVPVRGAGGVRLLGKHAIAWIGVHRRDEDTDDFADPPDVMTLYDRQHRVAVELATGTTLTGMLLDSSPADRPRVMDHLNRARRFVRLWTADEHYLLNKAQIVQVTELPREME